MPQFRLRQPVIVFIMALLLFNLFNWALPLSGTVEAIYGQVAKEMVEKGNYLVPHILGRPFFDKPPMSYWAVAVSFRLFGINDWAARFPGTFFAALSVVWLFLMIQKIAGRRAGHLSALVLAGTFEYAFLGRMVFTDLLLFAFVSTCLSCFYLGWRQGVNGRWLVRASYAFAALSVMTKGPVGLVVPGLVVALFLTVTGGWRRWRDLCLLSGLAVFFIIAGPWYIAVYHQYGRDFLQTFFGVHNYLRATVSEHPSDNRWWYYFVLLAVGFFPWFGMIPHSLKAAWPRAWRNWRDDQNRSDRFYFLCWAFVVFAFFMAMATKYPTYTLPSFFPLAALVGIFLAQAEDGQKQPNWLVLALWQLPVFLLMIILPAALYALSRMPFIQVVTTIWPLLALYALGILGLGYGLVKKNLRVLVATFGLIGLLQIPLLVGVVVGPHIEFFSAHKALEALREAGWQREPIGIFGGYDWSVPYYTGQKIPLLTEESPPDLSQLSWDVKRVMPMESPASFLARQRGRFYVLVQSGSLPKLPGLLRDRIRQVAEVGDLVIFESL